MFNAYQYVHLSSLDKIWNLIGTLVSLHPNENLIKNMFDLSIRSYTRPILTFFSNSFGLCVCAKLIRSPEAGCAGGVVAGLSDEAGVARVRVN